MEKIETRSARMSDDNEKALMTKCLEHLENDIPLCDVELEEEERRIVETAAPLSLKPVIKLKGNERVDNIISQALKKAGYMFFYTSGPRESHAWLVRKDSDIVSCAGRIHTDLARGFIKGDVVSFENYMNCHSFNECRSKGYARLVDRDYIVQPNEIVEIRFNVSNGSS
jgi:ribosome-binding ATPase YchF (GTP1/OBG family)